MPQSNDVHEETVLVVGATSEIAQAVSHKLAQRGCCLILAGRNEQELEQIAADLNVRYEIETAVERFDAIDFDSHGRFVERCLQRTGGVPDGVIVCHGYLPDREASENDTQEALRTININFASVVSVLTPIANLMASRRRGWIAVISSVAGDRGRQSNYIYGSSKAGLSAYLQGLRNRLFHAGVHVLTIKPGIVATAMTDELVDPKSPLVSTPERVAESVDRAIQRRSNTCYAPWFWWPVMMVIDSLPECVFKRLRL